MSTALTVIQPAHARLGASNAKRWMNCPGSVRLSELAPPDAGSPYAAEGTAAHEVAERLLNRAAAMGKLDPAHSFLGRELHGVRVTHEMTDAVQVYLDYCWKRARRKATRNWWVERRVSLAFLQPPEPMFGTTDFGALTDDGRVLRIVDYKHGQGVVVETKDNPQLKYYALGALFDIRERLGWDAYAKVVHVSATIVQPRAPHEKGPIRTVVYSRDALHAFAVELLLAARATQQPDAPLHAGEWCKFCPAAAICPEQRRAALDVAQNTFEVYEPVVPPVPELIPVDEFAGMLVKLPVLEDWIAAMKTRAHDLLLSGEQVPGFKLVEKRPSRVWSDHEETARWLAEQDFTDEQVFERKLRSVAQIEKLVGKKVLPPDQWQRVSSGYAVAPATDKRPAVHLHPGDAFPALPAGDAHTVGAAENE